MGEKKCFSAKHTVPIKVLMHKMDVSFFIDLVALLYESIGGICHNLWPDGY